MENRGFLARLDALLASRAANGRGNPFPIPTVRKIPPCQQAARTV